MYFEEIDERVVHVEEEQVTREPEMSVEMIKRAVFQLPDGYRVVFSLYLMEGYDHQEIADILNISVATSKSQFSRAKKKIRALLLSEESTKSV